MKRKSLFTLLMIGLLSFGLASCGSDNEGKDANGVTNTTSQSPFDSTHSSGITSCESASTFSEFKTKVNEGRFVEETNSFETYYYVEQEPNQNSGKFLGFIPYNTFQWDTLGQFTRNSEKDSQNIYHEVGNRKVNVRDFLMNILNNQVRDIRGGGSYLEVLTHDGKIYGIDLCKPIAANPVYEADTESGQRYFYTGKGGSYSNNNFGFTAY